MEQGRVNVVMQRVARASALVAVAFALATFVLVAPEAGSSSSQPSTAVDVTIESGVGGVVTDAPRVPIRVMLTSDRARKVRVELSNDLGDQYYELELNANAPTPLDAVVQAPIDRVEVEVDDLDGRRVGVERADIEVDPDQIVVGVGASIAGHQAPWTSPTIAGIQQATLVPLARDLLDRPGVLDMLTGLVLAPTDVEGLSDAQARRIGAWVAAGGNLALDQSRSDPLPVLGTDAEPGDRTAVEAGWVRFTGGEAAKGAWSSVIEPGVLADTSRQGNVMDMGMGMGFEGSVFDEQLRHTGFLQISYLSSSVIIAAVFVTSLIVGPLLWLVLRSRTRRRWMWFIAPTLSVAIAALLVTTGQGVLSDATTTAMGTSLSTGWSTRGEFGFGTTSEQADIDVGVDGQIWASSPVVRVAGSGADRTARQAVGPNSFGYVGLGLVDVVDAPLVSVTATAHADGKVSVSVTNHSKGLLTGVDVRGFSRTRGFADVAAGTTETLDFESSDDLSVFSPEFPIPNDQGIVCMDNFCTDPSSGAFGRAGFATYSSRGRVEIRGTLTDDVEIAGHRHSTTMQVLARAAVEPASDEPASNARAVRIESIGPQVLDRDDGAFQANDAIGVFPDDVTVIKGGVPPVVVAPPDPAGGAAPTTQAPPVTITFDTNGNQLGPDGLPIEPSLPVTEPTTVYALMSAPADIDSLRCSVHTILDKIEVWTDGAWVAAPAIGAPGPNDAFNEPNETRDYDFGRLGAGDTRILRMSAGLAVNAAPAFLCRGES